jgi:hypothetical protein
MNILPRYNEAVIPMEKLTEYALNPNKQPHKALAFELALGYNQDNAEKLAENIISNLHKFSAKSKGDRGFGTLYEVVMELTGENGKTARVLVGWIDDVFTGEMRLVSVYVDKPRGGRL